MAEITASMVKELREKTDAPMMECKKALSEAAGDLQKAEEILRVRLGAKATKAATRITAEGRVGLYISPDNRQGAIVEVNCETDFVAKNDDFISFIDRLAKLVVDQKPADVAALSALELDGTTVEAIRSALIGKIGENMTIRRFVRTEAQGKLFSYVHGGSKIGVLVDLEGGDDTTGKDLAMHIAALKPKSLDASGISSELIESERRVATEKAAEAAANSDKPIPADITAKRIEGAVQKFINESTLLGQQFVKNDKVTVEKLLNDKKARVSGYTLYVVGEGIEKKSSDFAAEVAAQQAAAQAKK